MGLFRLFWVPEGSEPAQGGYVYYPAQDFLGILALESHRQKVIIVGEDLGTVTPEIRKALMQAGLLSYRLLLFEKTPSGAFLPPGRYPAQAMASVTTHDLPTLHGFWIGRDIELKEQLHLYPHASLIERDRVARDRDRQALLTALTKERLLPASFGGRPKQSSAMDDGLAGAVYAYLARTPCRLVAIPLEDLLDDIETPNLPGAPPEAYPLWRRKAGPPGTTIRDWRTNSRVQAMAQTLRVERATQP
jgi:(1->4)-alpha-D-glucan 1-alpha-D-glucosylmutase